MSLSDDFKRTEKGPNKDQKGTKKNTCRYISEGKEQRNLSAVFEILFLNRD